MKKITVFYWFLIALTTIPAVASEKVTDQEFDVSSNNSPTQNSVQKQSTTSEEKSTPSASFRSGTNSAATIDRSQEYTQVAKGISQTEGLPATKPQSSNWSLDNANCSTFYKDGTAYQVFRTPEFKIACAMSQTKKYSVAQVVIKNLSNHVFDVLPDNFLMGDVPPIELNKDNKAQARTAHTLAFLSHGSYVPGEGYQSPLRANTSMSGTINGNSSSSTFSGSSTTTYSRRPSLVGLVAGHAAKVADTTALEIQNIKGQMLRANTLQPGEGISGCLFFAKSKKVTPAGLAVTVGNQTIVFPIAPAG
jgi:hypothetical protein